MLSFYTRQNGKLTLSERDAASHEVGDIVWADILDITPDEERLIEKIFGIDVPTREEMAQIELSSRLYVDDDAIFATATMISNSGTVDMERHPVTFVLVNNSLLTLRYSDPTSFRLFTNRVHKIPAGDTTAHKIFTLLLETIIDRHAEILNQTGHRFDDMTRKLFFTVEQEKDTVKKNDLEETMRLIGVNGDLVSKSVESLLSFSRLIGFLKQQPVYRSAPEDVAKLDAVSIDIAGLIDHASFLSNKVNFLLDTTLGMLSIQQNAIIKIFSVAAVIFLPPTLVASIYGMNFTFMPELHMRYGYPMALAFMVLSAIIPYAFFRRKGWL